GLGDEVGRLRGGDFPGDSGGERVGVVADGEPFLVAAIDPVPERLPAPGAGLPAQDAGAPARIDGECHVDGRRGGTRGEAPGRAPRAPDATTRFAGTRPPFGGYPVAGPDAPVVLAV